jgi:hypothetical protein
MRDRRSTISLVLILTVACAVQPASPAAGHPGVTGLQGTVSRGPIQPVCHVGEPCDAPFSAGFQVWQRHLLVARFHSDSAGHFQVLLAPGAYTVVADSGAPIWPAQQPHDVTVGPVGLTQVDLDFDTGIR